jgi:GNAT superfamily N-acetyltransferase
MHIINIRDYPAYLERAIAYFQSKWADENSAMVYEDCISWSLKTENPLPIWYLLLEDEQIVGCAGLVTNDFISRMDLWPWLVALYIEEDLRGNAYGSLLIERIKKDAAKAGYKRVYLSTDHIGYYEKYGFQHIGKGYHPWGGSSRIYECIL